MNTIFTEIPVGIVVIISGTILLFLTSKVYFFIKTGSFGSSYANSEIVELLKSDFNSQYKLDIIQEKLTSFGEPSFIVFANDSRVEDYCSFIYKSNQPSLILLPPIIRIYEKRSSSFLNILPFLSPYKKVFEFKPKLLGNDHWGDPNNLFIQSKNILSLDNSGAKRLAVRIMTTGCGDGSEIYPLLISNTQGRYGLEQSLPPVAYFKEAGMSGGKYGNECAEVVSKATKNGWEPTSLFSEKDVLNLADNSTTTLLSATTDDFIDWRDLDKDGIPELVIAVMKWDSTECHFCSHYWWVGVYKYQNGEFNVDNNFNSGLLLSTENKYDLYDIQGWIPIPNNIFGIVSGYFGLGYIESNKLINFNFGSRTESKIWKEVNLHYHISQ